MRRSCSRRARRAWRSRSAQSVNGMSSSPKLSKRGEVISDSLKFKQQNVAECAERMPRGYSRSGIYCDLRKSHLNSPVKHYHPSMTGRPSRASSHHEPRVEVLKT